MIAFVDFEASSLNASSYPIEVGWIREDGSGEAYLIRPEADWTDWSCEAYELHGISREKLLAEGLTAACVARRVSSVLSEHDLFSDAPAQDTYWLTVLLDTANLPTMRLRDSYEAFAAACRPLTRRFHASLVTPWLSRLSPQPRMTRKWLPNGVTARATTLSGSGTHGVASESA